MIHDTQIINQPEFIGRSLNPSHRVAPMILSSPKKRVRNRSILGTKMEITEIAVVSMHHDISTVTGEEVVLFTLAETPRAREPKKNPGF